MLLWHGSRLTNWTGILSHGESFSKHILVKYISTPGYTHISSLAFIFLLTIESFTFHTSCNINHSLENSILIRAPVTLRSYQEIATLQRLGKANDLVAEK